MATSKEFIDYVCDQLSGSKSIRYKKMFGEYMVYANDKPVVLVCDETVFVKKLDCIESLMQNAEVGYPYKGAKEHYILDIENAEFARKIVDILEEVTPLPKKKH